MADISIPWGEESLTVALPRDWTVVQTAAASVARAGEDGPDRLAAALARPEGLPALEKMLAARPGGRIAVVVEDLTRHSPLQVILPVIFRELAHAKVPNEKVEIVFATGMHPPLTAAEAAGKIGPELAGSVPWRSNPCQEEKSQVDLGRVRAGRGTSIDLLVDRGVVQADLRILVSSVSPHLQAGFGGGYKMLVPGCAGLETVRQLHLSGLLRRPAQQVGQTCSLNRMRQLIDQAGAAIDAFHGVTFGVQYVLDAGDQVSSLVVGEVASCQRLLAKAAAAGYGSMVEAPADVVIANAHPRDFDLWQSLKAVVNTSWAVRTGGVLICLSRCQAGANGMPTVNLPLSQKFVRRVLRLTGAEALASLMTRLIPSLSGERSFFVRLALEVLRRHTVLMVARPLVEAGVKLTGMPAFATAEEAFAAAEGLLGKGPKRVIVFPTGGVSYPVMPR
jgi:nickel-dependent lactate racemase